MPAIHIRRCTEQDAATLATLARDSFVETFAHLYSPEDLSRFLSETYYEARQRAELTDPHTSHFIAEVDGTAVGFAKMGAFKLPVDYTPENALELHRLYILAPYQRLGLGRLLMQEVLLEAERLKASELYLGVWENNHKAQRFYAGFGFEKIGEHSFVVGKTIDREYTLKRRMDTPTLITS